MRRILWTMLWCIGMVATAQTFSPERTGGVYYAYPVTASQRMAMPDGYEPFYISHYGRHGSRWLPSEDRYEWVAAQFEDDANLTPLGKSVKRRLKKICKNARGNAGQLTRLGEKQHRGIARRMVQNYPEVFAADGAEVQARSSTVPRCRASMLAFCGELPCPVEPKTDPAFMAYINHESAELKALQARTRRQPAIDTRRFVNALFNDGSRVTDDKKLLSELHTIASDMQDIPLTVSLWDIFTMEEMTAVHAANDERMTICNGDTLLNEGIPARSSIALWQNIEAEADAMIASGGHGASLRFGHDTALYRLLSLLRLQLPGKGMENILPMGANLQMVFLKPSGQQPSAESVLVGFLLNEAPTRLPSPLTPHHSPFTTPPSPLTTHPSPLTPHPSPVLYSWAEVKQYMHERIHALEHLRQLSALNTMVGTDQANTLTAGLFGKGSEEKGQTLPAVLVPNGQTFWTPQTRATEQKCVAPYYYRDTLFQGIRASHWLVGGCTQDYGSFTVSVFGKRFEKLGKSLADGTPGTRFSHDDEVSHPFYYAVTLPDEQLRLELTALSHSAILRITPQVDGPVHVVVTSNSDEQEGGVTVDADRHQVYGFNPVHRIYQGWGQRAGFSGHFLLEYPDSLTTHPSPLTTHPSPLTTHPSPLTTHPTPLTFNGRAGQPIVLRMATSFTGSEGAESNLRAESNVTFEQMEQQCIDRWTARLHTIDVSDPDTARVNQFYGALYRASFLPREMSDADGCYPLFSQEGMGMGRRSGDFSMWDTYRALHPLLTIIAPEETGQMMQSLVGMYEEGGWLPIFPCWNSYTAAMIGDHCVSVLADAYVKGIRGFDATKAYEAMRKNAFEQPATFKEYQDGMGRRALGSYLKYGYIPLEDSVKEAFHQQEQTSRTLEYAYDDFCVAQMAKALTIHPSPFTPHPSPLTTHPSPVTTHLKEDYTELMRRSENWRNVINPLTGYADGRHDPSHGAAWENNRDLVHRKPYITEGATCHYTWYVPQNIDGLIDLMGGREPFVLKLDSMFTEGRYWHGNEPCHQVAWLYSMAGQPEKTRQRVSHILRTEYNDSPGGLSGNDDAGQMSAWQVFASLGFYPVCPATPTYVLGGTQFRQVTINQPGGSTFVIRQSPDASYRLNGRPLPDYSISHADIVNGGELLLPRADLP